jgi:ABC-2 type transport system ATP-binding protein
VATVIETIELTKNYGKHQAVRGVNLSVQAGSVCAFLGQNGAGKSSTIKMLLGMIHPTSGIGSILGHRIDNERESLLIRQKVAFVAEDKRLIDYMSVGQIIHFTKSFFPKWNHALEARLLDQFELPPERKIRQLSKGMRTKLALLPGFARGCELLILDEPTEGLIRSPLRTSCRSSCRSQPKEPPSSSHRTRSRQARPRRADGSVKEQYRHIQAVFPEPVEERNFRLPGIEKVSVTGRTVSFVASHNVDSIVEHVRMLHAGSIDVLPISLKEIFLEKVKARS